MRLKSLNNTLRMAPLPNGKGVSNGSKRRSILCVALSERERYGGNRKKSFKGKFLSDRKIERRKK